MLYLHCPRCRLSIRCRAASLAIEHCPRCLARARLTVPLFTSSLPGTQLHAGSTRGEAAERPAPAVALPDVPAAGTPSHAKPGPRRSLA